MIFTSSFSCSYCDHDDNVHIFVSENNWIEDINIDSEIISGLNVSLNWECGEGRDGDYDCDNVEDSPLLRFDVWYKGDQMENGSQCTRLKATDNKLLLVEATKIILRQTEHCLLSEEGLKRDMERLSWMEIYNDQIMGL